MMNLQFINDERNPKRQFPSWFLGIGHYFIILVWSFIILSMLGCSRTVTSLVNYGDQMAVQVTLRGTMEVNANRYFFVLGSSSTLNVPLPPPDNIEDEMLEPGDDPLLGNIGDYYSEYYVTWDAYVILDPGGFFLVDGPFVSGEVTTRESLSSVSDITPILNFSIPLESVYSTVPDNIYFDFVSVEWLDGEAKIPSDHLTSTDPYISKISGSIIVIDDGEDSGVEASLDIVECRVEIQ